MGRIDEKGLEVLRTKTVEVLLEIRSAYLATPGANALKHWTLLQNRMRAAARTTATPEEWASSLCRGLQIQALGSAGARTLVELVHEVAERRCAPEWLDLVEREHTYLMALTRRVAEERAAKRSEVKETT